MEGVNVTTAARADRSRAGRIRIEHAERATLLVLSGNHSLFTAPRLARELTRALDARRDIVVDVAKAVLIDSSVVGLLTAARRHADERGHGLALVVGSQRDTVARLFRIAGGASLVPLAATREGAIECARLTAEVATLRRERAA